uniref:Uncharacterized protein n=1 Tax=Anguilla anguilla TaxID=7936 RepID=A0A0E9SJS6_ANGAN
MRDDGYDRYIYKINVYESLAICQILEYDKSVGF